MPDPFVICSKSGHGILNWPDGASFEGNWDRGARVGKGVLTLANGTRFEEDAPVDSLRGV